MEKSIGKRTATPERWALALLRAHGNGVQIFQLAGSGQWVATSASKPGVGYITDGVSCECEAATLGNDPVCIHRALYWETQGVIELAVKPSATVAEGATIADVVTFLTPEPVCLTCKGTKRVRTEGFDGATMEDCWVCKAKKAA